jgi:hypothetical protein
MRRVAAALYFAVALASVFLASVQPGQADGLAVSTVAMADEVGTWAVDAWEAAADSLTQVDAGETP